MCEFALFPVVRTGTLAGAFVLVDLKGFYVKVHLLVGQ